MMGITLAGLASWSMKFAVTALVFAAIGVLAFRLEMIGDFRLPLLLVAIGTLLALIAALLSLIALIGSLVGDSSHVQSALIALVVSLAVAYVPLNVARQGSKVPVIHDISTDLENPPIFKTVPSLRKDSDNSLALDPGVQAQQKSHYVDLKPLVVSSPPAEVFDKVIEVMGDKGWKIASSDRTTGLVEAMVETAFFKFKDDVIVRLTPVDGGTQVDMRSASRVGQSDLGANAARIEDFFDALD
jgi:uncharacterized protein (DUF1499 family)